MPVVLSSTTSPRRSTVNNEDEAPRSGDSGPLLFEKKMLPKDKIQHLQQLKQRLIARNNEVLSAEKAILDNYIEKGDAFVRRLEEQLEMLRSQNAQSVVLSDSMIGPVADADEPSGPRNQDAVQILKSWYPVMEKYVKTQQAKVNELTNEWFNSIQEALKEGDDKTKVADSKSETQPITDKTPHERNEIVFYCSLIVLIILAAVNIWWFYDPKDAKSSVEGDRFSETMIYYFSPVYNKYLELHNISFESETVADPSTKDNIDNNIEP